MGSESSFIWRALFMLLLCPWLSADIVWQGTPTIYIGFPGITTERYAFLSKYSTYFCSPSTGERIKSKTLDIVQPKYTHVVEFSEIIAFQHCWWWQRCWNSFWRKGVWARQTGVVFEGPTSLWNSVAAYGVNRSEVNMGGPADTARIESSLKTVQETLNFLNPEDRPKSVWLAYSRGVTALLRYLSVVGVSDEVRPHALILEGGIDDVPHFLNHFFDTHLPQFLLKMTKPTWLIKTLVAAFKFFYAPCYQDPAGQDIRWVLERVPDDIPILLVASKGDELVSYRCMVRIYDILRKIRQERNKPFDNVHLLLLQRPRHSYYVNGVQNFIDRALYESCVHAFYKKYNFAYDIESANNGEVIFEESNAINVRALLESPSCKICNGQCGV